MGQGRSVNNRSALWHLSLFPSQDWLDTRRAPSLPRDALLQSRCGYCCNQGVFGTNGFVQLRSHPVGHCHATTLTMLTEFNIRRAWLMCRLAVQARRWIDRFLYDVLLHINVLFKLQIKQDIYVQK